MPKVSIDVEVLLKLAKPTGNKKLRKEIIDKYSKPKKSRSRSKIKTPIVRESSDKVSMIISNSIRTTRAAASSRKRSGARNINFEVIMKNIKKIAKEMGIKTGRLSVKSKRTNASTSKTYIEIKTTRESAKLLKSKLKTPEGVNISIRKI